MNFVHLHVHTDCSFLDGAARSAHLAAAAASMKMPALAITDHGGLFGLIEFHEACKRNGVKPILGCELYVAPGSRLDRNYSREDRKYDHLVVLARNEEGYRNLLALSSAGYTEGFYFKPRVDKELLKKHSAGLIGLSACVQGEVPHALISKDPDRAARVLDQYLGIFGRDNFFIELQDHGLADEIRVNPLLMDLARTGKVAVVATNDVHYLKKTDSEVHDTLLCVQTGALLTDKDRLRFDTNEFYFKTAGEMAALFQDCPEALSNTLKIADRCNLTLSLGKRHLWPVAPLQEGFKDNDEYLAFLSKKGFEDRFPDKNTAALERLDFELSVIAKMGVSGYMLIVNDIIETAKRMGVPVGPGRGSCVGSLVSYCLGITALDPLKYGLLFERFLNPERVSMPDIDIDFGDREREKVIEYVSNHYGASHVCLIGTRSAMKAKNALRDVGRAMGFSVAERDAACAPAGDVESMEKAVQIPAFTDFFNQNESRRKWLDVSSALEGLNRQAGVHAAGLVISPGPVTELVPVYRQKNADKAISQYDKDEVDAVGLLKIDCLGLRNLTVIREAVRLIKETRGTAPDPLDLPLNDEKTFALFSKGATVGVFQFESGGMREYLRALKPDCLEDLIAMNALYRPGPMECIPSYISRKHGREAVSYPYPTLAPILKETFGIIVYQEQVMQAARIIGGFSLGKADILRRAISKKKQEEMDKLRVEFLAGAKERKIPDSTAIELYDLVAKFADYGFNKSHAAAYAFVAYQTAYLKANFPVEFMAANLTSESDKTDRLAILLDECRSMGIVISPPDVNKSGLDFTPDNRAIRFGLSAIKNIGTAAAMAMIAERGKGGAFSSYFNFVKRMDPQFLNARTLESLVFAGALDGFGKTRTCLFRGLETAISYAASEVKRRESGQVSFFETGGAGRGTPEPDLEEPEPLPYSEILTREKELLGIYVSGNPMDKYADEISCFTTLDPENPALSAKNGPVVLGGVINSVVRRIYGQEKRMAVIRLECLNGRQAEVLVFDKQIGELEPLLVRENVVLFKGKAEVSNNGNGVKLIAESALLASEARERLTRAIQIRVRTRELDMEKITAIKKTCVAHPGKCRFMIRAVTADGNEFLIESADLRVSAAKGFTDELKKMAGPDNVRLER